MQFSHEEDWSTYMAPITCHCLGYREHTTGLTNSWACTLSMSDEMKGNC